MHGELSGIDVSLQKGINVGALGGGGKQVVEIPQANTAVIPAAEMLVFKILLCNGTHVAVGNEQFGNLPAHAWRKGVIHSGPPQDLSKLPLVEVKILHQGHQLTLFVGLEGFKQIADSDAQFLEASHLPIVGKTIGPNAQIG